MDASIHNPVITNQKWSGEHFHLSEKKNYLKEIIPVIACIALTIITNILVFSTAPGFHQTLRSKLVTLIGGEGLLITALLVDSFAAFGIVASIVAMYFKYNVPSIRNPISPSTATFTLNAHILNIVSITTTYTQTGAWASILENIQKDTPHKFSIQPPHWETKNDKIILIDYFLQKQLETVFLCDHKNELIFSLVFNAHKKIVDVTNFNPIGKINKYTQLILLSPNNKLEIDLKQRPYHFSSELWSTGPLKLEVE